MYRCRRYLSKLGRAPSRSSPKILYSPPANQNYINSYFFVKIVHDHNGESTMRGIYNHKSKPVTGFYLHDPGSNRALRLAILVFFLVVPCVQANSFILFGPPMRSTGMIDHPLSPGISRITPVYPMGQPFTPVTLPSNIPSNKAQLVITTDCPNPLSNPMFKSYRRSYLVGPGLTTGRVRFGTGTTCCMMYYAPLGVSRYIGQVPCPHGPVNSLFSGRMRPGSMPF